MEIQILTNTMKEIGNIYNKIPSNLESISLWLLCTFTTIDIGLLIFKVDEIDWIKILCRKAFKVGVLIFIIRNYSEGLNLIMNSFIAIGTKASDSFNADFINNPSLLIDYVFDLGTPIYQKMGFTSGTGWLYNFIAIFIWFSGIAIALQVFVTWLEVFALTGITIIFIPFTMIDKFSFLTEKAIGIIISLAIKLMVLSMILGVSTTIIKDLNFSSKATIQEGIHILSILLSLTYLICRVPSLAASMMNGNPSLSSGDMAGMVRSSSAFVGGAIGSITGGLINMGLGGAGKGSIGQLTQTGKAHTMGKMANVIGKGLGINNKLSGSNRGKGSSTAPGGKENSDRYQRKQTNK